MKRGSHIRWFIWAGGVLLSACGGSEVVTFSKDIAPILYANCMPCHRVNGAGPFPLITYRDAVSKAKTIKRVTQAHLMPPWPADTSYSRFLGERFLSQQQLDLISEWVDNDCPMGDSTKIPQPPSYTEGSYLGKPDKVVKMGKPFFIKGNNADNFALMKLPFELEHDTFIKALEFVPCKKI